MESDNSRDSTSSNDSEKESAKASSSPDRGEPASPPSRSDSRSSSRRSPVSDRGSNRSNRSHSSPPNSPSPANSPKSPENGHDLAPKSPDSASNSPTRFNRPPKSPQSDSNSPTRDNRPPKSPQSDSNSPTRFTQSPKSPQSDSNSPIRTNPGAKSPESDSNSPTRFNPPPRSPQSDSNSPTRARSPPKSPQSDVDTPTRTRSPPKSPQSDLDTPTHARSPRSRSRSNSPCEANGYADARSPLSGKSSVKSPGGESEASNRSDSSRARSGRRAANLDDGNTSDSSESSDDSSGRRSRAPKPADTQPEEISDGDMELDNEKDLDTDKECKKAMEAAKNLNMNHEDLSDVSDLDDSIGSHSDEETLEKQASELRQKIEEIRKPETDVPRLSEKTSRTEDGEEQLDFEAEDGECPDIEPSKDSEEKNEANVKESGEIDDEAGEKKEKEKEELEEGEVTDEDEVRPEETEPRPVCRFFSRGQCTWGASCRFLHPGVTDKGNYTMFEMIRPVIPGCEYGRDDRGYGRPEPMPPPMESAWERGLRTAKEMLRKSMKRKEQDIDFEEKKMNLSLAQEELDKENGYYGRGPSPEPRYVSVRHAIPVDYPPVVRPPPEEYYGRRQVLYEPEYVPPPRERVRTFRELPPHRMPDYYNNKYEDEAVPAAAKSKRPKREVIVQRAEERQGRADEWSDPWMRSKSPTARKGRKRSYSSGSSYSSSSSSRSSSGSSRSSYRSRSRSPRRSGRSPRGHRGRQAVSPSVIVSERKAAIERAALMNPPAPKKKAPSPGMMRAGAQNPPAPSKVDQFGRTRSKLAAALARVKNRQRSSRSSSGSSGSSSSDSDSSDSSSSSSREGSSPPRRPSGVSDLAMALKAKAIDALKGGSAEKRQIKLNLKNPMGVRKADIADLSRKIETVQGKKRPANSPPSDSKSAANKKATSRREELLKQLKAVEDAIAKKRSKVN